MIVWMSPFTFQPFAMKSHRHPVQQRLVDGRRALSSEVLLSLDDPDAENLAPEAVDGDARRERVLLVDNPLRQPQSIGRRADGHRIERRKHCRQYGGALVKKIPLHQHMILALFPRRKLAQ